MHRWGAILALVLGAGLAERVGLTARADGENGLQRERALRQLYGAVYRLFSHISSDAALVIMPPMGALIFLAVGRHPVAGLLAAIA
ncbi:AbgT family transporter, partial [Enterobacter soli]